MSEYKKHNFKKLKMETKCEKKHNFKKLKMETKCEETMDTHRQFIQKIIDFNESGIYYNALTKIKKGKG